MPNNYQQEEWKLLSFPAKDSPRKKYVVSNHGRIAAYKTDISEKKILKGSVIGGYPSMKIRINYVDKTFYIHRLVGDLFVQGRDAEHNHLIHLDFDKKNNHVSNLKWVTREKSLEHNRKNPAVIEAKKRQALYRPEIGHKLTSTDVMRMKKMIWDPNRRTRLRMIARQFGISEMQLYRIKSGENWSHIRVENEPAVTQERKKRQ